MRGRTKAWIGAIGLLAASGFAIAAAEAQSARAPLIVGSWGGAYEDAVKKTLFDGFTNRTGIIVESFAQSDLDSVRRAAQDPGRRPSVVDLPALDAEQLCNEGLAVPLGADLLARTADNQPPEQDFLFSIGPCGVPATVSAEVLLYDKNAMGSNAPSKASDLFDLQNFPGKRALKRDAQGTLEWALIADGIAPDQVYLVLSTPQGADRAFAKLDRIRDQILWWDHGDVPIKALARKEVVMAAVYGARAYQAVVGDAQPFEIVWNEALVSPNCWVLLKDARDPEAAREFIKFATDRERLAELGRTLPYGPVRKSALDDIPAEKRAYLPSAAEHFGAAVKVDAGFWLRNGKALRQRFEAWLATPPARTDAAAKPVAAKSTTPVAAQSKPEAPVITQSKPYIPATAQTKPTARSMTAAQAPAQPAPAAALMNAVTAPVPAPPAPAPAITASAPAPAIANPAQAPPPAPQATQTPPAPGAAPPLPAQPVVAGPAANAVPQSAAPIAATAPPTALMSAVTAPAATQPTAAPTATSVPAQTTAPAATPSTPMPTPESVPPKP
jgi:putative spermidine/putrescine transport system substrate-binding protein